MFDRILSALILLTVMTTGAASAQDPVPPQTQDAPAPAAIAKAEGLDAILRKIAALSGIRFELVPGLKQDRVSTALSGMDWTDEVRHLLRDYNYVGTWDGSGRLSKVDITGRKGDGSLSNRRAGMPASPELLSYRSNSGSLPKRYGDYAEGSVHAIEIPIERLRRMPIGSRITAELPDGRYQLVHDRVWQHGNGDATWVGYVEGVEGGPYRALLTLGENGVEGDIRTPGGVYQLESEGNLGWLADMNASGLQAASLEGDQNFPAMIFPGLGRVPASFGPTGERNGTDSAAARPAALGPSTPVEIDLAMLYTAGLASDRIVTKLNHLVALADQAMLDSGAPVRLRLVAIRRTSYPDGGSNIKALENLTGYRQAFRNVPGLRSRFGADMILAIRSFKLRSQGGNCGEAWVNGAGGSPLSPDLAFGVLGYGSSGGYYCPQYTLAHEAGHILGAVHDRDHADFEGAYPFSFGFGVPRVFGDIMSYIDPQIGLYANPDILCADQACGIAPGQPGQADVVETFKRTAATVADFMSKVVP